ncbi:MAG TPA: serine/threonine-protein kinase [Candidatus Obscuribacterales bacterium]
MPSLPPSIGSLGYKPTRVLSNGLFGARWAVEQDDSPKSATADIVTADTEYKRQLWENAAKTKDWVTTSNVATVIECGLLEDGDLFQIADLSPDALPLADALPPSTASEATIIKVFLDILSGLSVMHKSELAHGMICPRCIYMEGDRYKLAELWWAHNADGKPLASNLSYFFPANPPPFALSYIAPEVLLGETPRRSSDVYSFGAVLYLMASGRAPREIDARGQRPDRKTLEKEVPKLAELRPDLSPMLTGTIDQMLHIVEYKRPATPALEAFEMTYSGRAVPD